MTQQVINIGSAPNDGTGDQLRISFDKCNGNFTELYQGVAANAPLGNAIEYQFNNSTTEPPASGQIRLNQATQAATTKLWVSQTAASGINIKQFLSAATTGSKLILQDKNDNTNYLKLDVTGAPVDKTTYWEFPVAVTASGGALPNARILAAVTAAAGGGGAPLGAEYITSTADATLTSERVLTDTATVTWDRTTAGQIKATAVGGSTSLGGRLSYVSATALKFAPFNGNQIKINGTVLTIPNAGIAGVANTSVFVNGTAGQNLAASTVYWVFAFNNGGTVTADFRTAATHATSTTAGNEGVEILTGNDTRTLIGMVSTNASSQFQSDVAYIGVLSWFNKRLVAGKGVFTADRSTTATSLVELSTEIRVNSLSWANETVLAGFSGAAANATGLGQGWTVLAVDGTVSDGWSQTTSGSANYYGPIGCFVNVSVSEGWHYYTLFGNTSGGTEFWVGYATAGGRRCSLTVATMG